MKERGTAKGSLCTCISFSISFGLGLFVEMLAPLHWQSAIALLDIVHNNPVIALLMLAHLAGPDPVTALSKLADSVIDESICRRLPRRKRIKSETSAIFHARARAIKSMMKSLQVVAMAHLFRLIVRRAD